MLVLEGCKYRKYRRGTVSDQGFTPALNVTKYCSDFLRERKKNEYREQCVPICASHWKVKSIKGKLPVNSASARPSQNLITACVVFQQTMPFFTCIISSLDHILIVPKNYLPLIFIIHCCYQIAYQFLVELFLSM